MSNVFLELQNIDSRLLPSTNNAITSPTQSLSFVQEIIEYMEVILPVHGSKIKPIVMSRTKKLFLSSSL